MASSFSCPGSRFRKVCEFDRFRFCPLAVKDIKSVVEPEIVATIESVLKCYVRKNGEPIKSCTIVLRARHQQAWNIPCKHWDIAVDAAKTLALACLAEQRFFEGHFSPHLNGTMFRLIGQGVAAGSDQIAPFYPRRGGGLQIGGLRFKDIVFQRPPQIEGTDCLTINNRLLKALERARRSKAPYANAIDSSLEVFCLPTQKRLNWIWTAARCCQLLPSSGFLSHRKTPRKV